MSGQSGSWRCQRCGATVVMRDGDDRVGCGCVGKRTTAETALLAAAIAKAGGIDLMAALDVIDALESDGWKVGRE